GGGGGIGLGRGTIAGGVAAVAGPAIARASRDVADRARRVAAETLECAPDDVVLAGGRAHVAGFVGRGVALGDLARAAVRSKALAAAATPPLHARPHLYLR